MKRESLLLIVLSILVFLVGCSSQTLNAPCPSFGRFCKEVPINSWNTQNRD